MQIFFIVASFVLGSCIGSYLCACIDSIIHKKKLVVWERSKCNHCKRTIAPYHMIPILSGLLLRFKCPSCKTYFGIYHVIVELLTGIIWMLPWIFLPMPMSIVSFLQTFLPILIFASITVYIGTLDYFLQEFPVRSIVVASVFLLLHSYFFYGPLFLFEHLITALSFVSVLGLFLLLGVKKGQSYMGEGDLYIGFLIGSYLLFYPAYISLTLASVLGLVVGGFLLIAKKMKYSMPIPFAPFLLGSAYLVSIFFPHAQWFLLFSSFPF